MLFEAKVTKKRRQQFEQSVNFKNGKFTYPIETKKDLSFKNIKSVVAEGIKGNPNKRPKHKLPFKRMKREMLANHSGKATVTWFGHSSVCIVYAVRRQVNIDRSDVRVVLFSNKIRW